MIRKGDEFRIDPIRILVTGNNDGRCFVHVFYSTFGALGLGGTIDEEVLNKLAKEDGVIMNGATRKSDK